MIALPDQSEAIRCLPLPEDRDDPARRPGRQATVSADGPAAARGPLRAGRAQCGRQRSPHRRAGPPSIKRFVFEVAGFAVPPSYRGINGARDGHFVLIAVRAAAIRLSSAEFCLNEPTIGKLTIDGSRAVLVACPQGSYLTGGHVLLRWTHRGILVGVSFHGVNTTNIDLALAEARHLKWVSP